MSMLSAVEFLSILTRHYTDYSPERLKEIYEKANLKIL